MSRDLFYKISAERTNLEDKQPPFFYQQQKVYDYCKRYIINKKVLEIGSGSGYGAYKLSTLAKEITATDLDKRAINQSRKKFKKNGLRYVNSIDEHLYKYKFDVIISLQVLEHIKTRDTTKFITNIKNKLNPNGTFILSTPNKLTSSYNENPYHYEEYTYAQLHKLLINYFSKIEFYSLLGDDAVSLFETERQKIVLTFLKKDKFNLRKLIPIKIRQFLFDIITYNARKKYFKNILKIDQISEKNYRIELGENKKALDLIAICKI